MTVDDEGEPTIVVASLSVRLQSHAMLRCSVIWNRGPVESCIAGVREACVPTSVATFVGSKAHARSGVASSCDAGTVLTYEVRLKSTSELTRSLCVNMHLCENTSCTSTENRATNYPGIKGKTVENK